VTTYRDEGVVLRTTKLGEADRIVTILTATHGKVRAVGKGVRKTTSRMGGRLEPLSHVALLCWRGRGLDIVNQAERLDAFRPVRDDLGRLDAALALLEIADHATEEHAPAPELYAMVLGALRTLSHAPPALVLGAFCWKLLGLEGVGPSVDRCARCGQPGPLVACSIEHGGLLCASCRRGQAVSPAFVELVQAVCGGRLAQALRREHGAEVGELERLGLQGVERHLERAVRSTRHLLDEGRVSAQGPILRR